MERNSQDNYLNIANREQSNRIKSPESKLYSSTNFGFNKSTRSSLREMVSPTYKTENKEFTSTLRQGNKSSSKIRLKSANSMSLNNNLNEFYDKNLNLRSKEIKDKSITFTNTYGDNGKNDKFIFEFDFD